MGHGCKVVDTSLKIYGSMNTHTTTVGNEPNVAEHHLTFVSSMLLILHTMPLIANQLHVA